MANTNPECLVFLNDNPCDIWRPRWDPNVAGGEKSSLNRDSNPGPLAYRVSALPTELLKPEILTDFHTPGYPVTLALLTYLPI